MGGFACLCKNLRNKFERRGSKEEGLPTRCNCGWEIETGYAIASGLSILEGKRLFILAVGIFVEWNVLYFAGGLIPLVTTIVSASIGVPSALATVYTIHKRRRRPCFPLLKKLLKYLLGVISLCAILNLMTVGSIVVYLNTSPEAIARVFNESMTLYSEKTWDKVTVDEFQFTFQCCGHTKYNDWIAFDWQKVDYASREEMSDDETLSDERYRPMAVPFSCCNLRKMTPCFHADLSMDARDTSINEFGCADVMSRIVVRSAAVTYCVSTFLVLTQILLILVMIKIVRRPFPSTCPSICDCEEKSPSLYPLLESSTSCVSSTEVVCTSSSEQMNNDSSRSKKRRSRLSTISSRSTGRCSSSSPSPSPSPSPCSSKKLRKNSGKILSSVKTGCDGSCRGSGAARIRPSLHTEHRLPKKRSCLKRATGLRPN